VRRGAAWIARHEFWLFWVFAAPLVLSSNLPAGILYLAFAVIPVFWVARRIERGEWTVPTPLEVPLAILLGLGLVGIAVSNDTAVSIRFYLELVGGIAVYYSAVNGILATRFSYGIGTILVLGAGLGLVGLLGLDFSDKFLPVLIYPLLPKFNLGFLNPRGFTANIVAGAIAPVVPLALAWSAVRSGVGRIAVLALALGVMAIVILTQSRGALIGLGVAFGILLVWRIPRLIWLVPVAAALLAAAVFFFGAGNLIETVFASDSTGSAGGRLELWERAIQILRDFPFTGIGIGTFRSVVLTLYPLFQNDPAAPLPHAHNLYLQMGLDYGIGGIVAFVGLVLTALGMGARNIRRAPNAVLNAAAVGLLAGYVVYAMHSLLDAVAISTKVSIVVWLMLALMMALATERVRET